MVLSDWGQACGPALLCSAPRALLTVCPRMTTVLHLGGTFLLTQSDPSGFQMKTVGTWRASDLRIRLGLAGGPGALPALASFCGLGHSQDSARTELFLGAE